MSRTAATLALLTAVRLGTKRDIEGRARARLPHQGPELRQSVHRSSQMYKEPPLPRWDRDETHGF